MSFLSNRERKKLEKLKKTEFAEIKLQIDQCLDYIKALRRGFNETADSNLVNYYIYEKRAAEMKYHYLLGVYADMMCKEKADEHKLVRSTIY